MGGDDGLIGAMAMRARTVLGGEHRELRPVLGPGYTPAAMTTRLRLPALAGLAFGACLGVLQVCAREPYRPRVLDMQAAAADYVARRTDDPSLKQYLVDHGHPEEQWPVGEWGLRELALLALFYRAELQVARAQASAARTEMAAAAPRGPVKVTPLVAHHSQSGARNTPSSLGFDLDQPLLHGSAPRFLWGGTTPLGRSQSIA